MFLSKSSMRHKIPLYWKYKITQRTEKRISSSTEHLIVFGHGYCVPSLLSFSTNSCLIEISVAYVNSILYWISIKMFFCFESIGRFVYSYCVERKVKTMKVSATLRILIKYSDKVLWNATWRRKMRGSSVRCVRFVRNSDLINSLRK